MGEAKTFLSAPEEYLRKKTRDAQFYKRVKSARAHRESYNFEFRLEERPN